MIRVENLSVSYGHISALQDVSFHIDRGEIVTLIGSNGAGKSTSLMAISNLLLKQTGHIYFEDTDITDFAPPWRLPCPGRPKGFPRIIRL